VQAVRRRYLPDQAGGELVVAMAGGGADAHRLFDALVRAVPALLSQRRCAVVVVTGPFLPTAARRELQRLAHGLPVHLIPTVSDSLSYLAAADLVVAMAGYNTTAEILSLARRALLVPRAGPSAEQTMRASRFAERGWVRWLPPESLSADTLAGAVLEALATTAEPAAVAPDLGGRQRAVAHLLSKPNGRDARGARSRFGLPRLPGEPPRAAATELLGGG
jgi:predicted glycosyltransferase